MVKSALARVDEIEQTEESAAPRGTPRPFALRLAERVGPKPISKPRPDEVFDDPTTVDNTGQYEDPHTDEV